MHRHRWPAGIYLALGACLALPAIGAGLFFASQATRLPAPSVAPPRPPAGSATPLPPGLTYVTLVPLPTLGFTATETALASIAPCTSATSRPGTAEAGCRASTYTVVEGDTLWDIAVRFNFDIETLIAANPALDPNLLTPGEIIHLPNESDGHPEDPGATHPPLATPQAQVSAAAGGLRLRTRPGLAQPILTLLDAGIPLHVLGRTPDNAWLQVIVPQPGQTEIEGWVMARYVEVFISLDRVPVTGAGVAAPPSDLPGAGAPTPPPGEAAAQPYIANVGERVRQLFLFGQTLGNRPDVFSKVGDSITVSNAFLKPFGYGNYNLRTYAELQPVIEYYSQTTARDGNSFTNTSLAAEIGWPAQAVLSPKAADPQYCAEGEAPLVCEYRWVKPSVALIMLGTNDVPGTSASRFERHLREVLEISLELGVIPVLSTLPPMHRAGTEGRVALLNGLIMQLADEYNVPLWDYASALQGLPNAGLAPDGVHPSLAPFSADFSAENLQYGMTVRNLTALQALDAVWRVAGSP